MYPGLLSDAAQGRGLQRMKSWDQGRPHHVCTFGPASLGHSRTPTPVGPVSASGKEQPLLTKCPGIARNACACWWLDGFVDVQI
jgi:hypothetical protein